MSTQLKTQVTEIHNVMHTLVETTDHLVLLTEAEEMEQSLYIFASLIEGIEAVFKAVTKFEINVLNEMRTIETALPKMTKAFENEDLIQVTELTNTALQPALNEMKNCYGKVLEQLNK